MKGGRKKQQIIELQRQCQKLQWQFNGLMREQSALQQQVHLLDALCNSFSQMEAQLNVRFGCISTVQHDELIKLQSQLRQQLINSSAPTKLQEDEGVRRIASRNNQLALLDGLTSQPPAADSHPVTQVGLASMYSDSVTQGALLLHKGELGLIPPDTLTKQLEDIHVKFLQAYLSAVSNGRPDISGQVLQCNMATMQPDPDGAAAVTEALHKVPPRLGLTELQLHDISVGYRALDKILQDILQQQQQLFHPPFSTQQTGSLGQTSVDSSSGHHSGSSERESIESLDAQLDAQSLRAARMQLLFQKEHAIRTASLFWFLGCLSWEQVVRCTVMQWPYVLPTLVLAKEIARYAEEEQQQRLRQQQELAQRQQCSSSQCQVLDAS